MDGWMRMPRRLLFFLSLFAATATALDNGKTLTAEDFARGSVPRCSPGNAPTILTVQISPKLSPYQFTLVPEPVSTQHGDVHHVGRIEISKPGARAILQTIPVMSNWNDSVCRLFDATDVNFDGYLDISVVREGAATWASRDYYLFDPQSGRFVSNELTRDLGQVKSNGLILDWKTQEIQASFMFSLCGGIDIYRIANGRLVKVQKSEVTVDIEGKRCIETVRRRVSGKWKVLRVEATKLPKTGPEIVGRP